MKNLRKIVLSRVIPNTVIFLFALGSVACLWWWFTFDPTQDILERIPGMDGAPSHLLIPEEIIKIGEHFEKFDGVPSNLPGAWPRFRGENYDNISSESTELGDRWGKEGPEILWAVDLGEGHAGPVVINGRVYLMDYDEENQRDILRCFSLSDGREIWQRGYRIIMKRNHGMSRTIPAVTDKYVVTMGPRGQVMCVQADNGSFLWGIDLEREYDTTVPLWYTAQCPMIDGTTAVIAPGGRALMIGVDLGAGEVVWETPNPKGWPMSHSSIMPMTLNGLRMYVYCSSGGIAGIAAEGEERGKILWETTLWNPSVVAPSPVIFEDGRIFVTAGYGAGSMMLRVIKSNGAFSVEQLYSRAPEEGLACEQQTPVLYKGYLFGILPKDAGGLQNQFVCFDPAGTIVWASGKSNRFGLGPYIIADGKFFVLNDDGVLTLLKATPESYIQLDRAKVLDGRDAWGPMAIAGGRLILRDSKRMICIDVSAQLTS
jgi:outer membrane protein assembly factor BamB